MQLLFLLYSSSSLGGSLILWLVLLFIFTFLPSPLLLLIYFLLLFPPFFLQGITSLTLFSSLFYRFIGPGRHCKRELFLNWLKLKLILKKSILISLILPFFSYVFLLLSSYFLFITFPFFPKLFSLLLLIPLNALSPPQNLGPPLLFTLSHWDPFAHLSLVWAKKSCWDFNWGLEPLYR